MAESVFREGQWRHRYDDHIAPINRLVDALGKSGHGWLPYVAPMYGGVNARLLSLLRDPGPMTQASTGSGFLSMENDDATAQAISEYFAAAAIPACEIVPWNVYPWYINRAPKARELSEGVEPLRSLIELLPRLRVVMLHGVSARAGWKQLLAKYPDFAVERGLKIVSTYHTSRQAFWHADPLVRQSRKDHLESSFAQAAEVLFDVAHHRSPLVRSTVVGRRRHRD